MNYSLKYRKSIVEAKRAWDINPKQRILNAKSAIGQTITKRQKELAIFGGGVAILSKAEGKPILLYSPEVQKQFGIIKDTDKYEYLHTPYDVIWKKDGFSDFIDLLFFISRDKQRPEYVGKISELKITDKFEYPFQRSLRNDYEILHCSAGEILCFTLLWRLLIELAIKNNSLDCKYSKTLFQSQSQREDWFEVFQKPQNDVFEKLLIEKLIGERSISQNTLSQNVWEAQKEFSDSIKCGKSVKYIFNDLGLFKSKALTELNRYIQFVFKDKSLQLNKSNADDFADKIILAFAKAAKVETNKMSLENLLNGLHSYARFPILPYYFLMVFDKEKNLKEHIVFPLWYTFSPDTKYPYEKNKSESAVLHALYTVKPIWENKEYGSPVWYTSDSKSTTPKRQANLERYLNDLYSFFTSMSKPIIDKEYYATEAKKNINTVKRQATRAAISQVMARNMSHNIGSHVMNKLIDEDYLEKFCSYAKCLKSYQPIEDLEDQKEHTAWKQLALYNNYVKCRMDYLSDMSFGTPLMQTSKKVYDDLFREIDKVRLLLEHISGLGDGFPFYIEFQKQKESLSSEFEELRKDNDFPLAIPNDVLGNQALYNIIENLIRNTDKHSQANSKVKTKITVRFSDIASAIFKPPKLNSIDELDNLKCVEIFDSIDLASKKQVVVNTKEDKALNAFAKKNGIVTTHKTYSMPYIDWLVFQQNKKLNEPLLNDNNMLRANSLGLIEMEASASYLRKLDTTTIDEDDYEIEYNEECFNKKGKLNILKAIKIESEGKQYLGYRFYMLKPQEVLIVTDKLKDNPARKSVLKKEGIWVVEREEFVKHLHENNSVYNHQFVVHENLDTVKIKVDKEEYSILKYHKTSLPLRILKLDGTRIAEVVGKTPREIIEICWQNWNEDASPKLPIVNGQIPTFLDHPNLDTFNRVNSYYVDALTSNAKNKLPGYKVHIDTYIENLAQPENLIIKKQVSESIKTKVVVIDERIQESLSKTHVNDISIKVLYSKIGIIVPDKTVDINLSSASYSPTVCDEIKNIISKYLVAKIVEDDSKVELLGEKDFLLIHYSILERMFNESKNRKKAIDIYLKQLQTKTNIVITSGRGTPEGLCKDVRYVNLSGVLTAFTELRSKYLINYILHSSRKSNRL